MDSFVIVLFILVLFAIFICFKNRNNNETIIEGMEGITEEEIRELQNIRNLPGMGTCKENGNPVHGDHDEIHCTGLTGYKLSWVTIDEKKGFLSDLENLDADTYKDEVSVGQVDIVNVDGECYRYKGDEKVNISEEMDKKIALHPCKYDGNDEYCLNKDTGEYLPESTEATCESSDNGIWLNPLNSPSLPESWKNSACSISLNDGGAGDGEEKERAGGVSQRDCFKVSEIKLPVCSKPDGTQMRPMRFWKALHTPGITVEQACEGIPTGRDWHHGVGSTLWGDETIARIFASIPSEVNELDNEAARLEHNARTSERVAMKHAKTIIQELEDASLEEAEMDCSFEDVDSPYHGNDKQGSMGTINGYTCGEEGDSFTNDDGDPINNLSENCSISNLSCSDNFKRSVDPMNIRCSLKDEKYVFKYQGCEPNVCKIPDNFNEKYEFKDPSELRSAGHTVTINDVKDMKTQELKVKCKNGYSGEPTDVSCPDEGTLNISGCDLNVCSATCDSEYEFKGCNNIGNVSIDSFYETMNMNSPWDVCDTDFNNAKGPCFRCKPPNNFHLTSDDDAYNEYYNQKTEKVCLPLLSENREICSAANTEEECNGVVSNTEEQEKLCSFDTRKVKDIQPYPTVKCKDNNSPFTFSGCQQNQCINPQQEGHNFVYDSSRFDGDDKLIKPIHIKDYVKVDNDDIYSKYKHDNNPSSDEIIKIPDLNGKLLCGTNYTNKGQNNSSIGVDKTIPLKNIQCYNFYDYYNKSDPTTPVPNYSKPPISQKGDTIEYITSESELPTYLSENQSIPRNHYFSVGGCEENYCKWPTYNNISYNSPQKRINNDEKRFILGYKHDDLDMTTTQTARSFAGYIEGEGATLTCDTECTPEPQYSYEEINNFLSEVNDDDIKAGGNDNLHTAESFHEVARGGPFSISRCWNQTTSPTVICNGQECNKEDSDCNAVVSGCEQNKCTLSNEDQVNGTRIIIEGPLDNEGKPMYDTIGVKSDGSPKEHEAFNVDQIRHISCNNNYSKPLEDDGTIKDIEIRCPVDGGEFVIDNRCIRTECEGTKVVDRINLSSVNGDVNSICPNKTWENSHIAQHRGSNETDILVEDQGNINFNESCDPDSSEVSDEITQLNKSRYTQETIDGTSSIPLCNIDIQSQNISTFKIPTLAKSSCNYTPNINVSNPESTFSKPQYELSGCQPNLCKIPNEEMGYTYNNLSPGDIVSKELLFGPYFSENKPDFIVQDSYDSYINKSITCSEGYNGDVSLECNSSQPSCFPDCAEDFTMSGCSKNKCIIPNKEAPSGSDGRKVYDNLSEEEQKLWDNIINQYNILGDDVIKTQYEEGEKLTTDELRITQESNCGPNHKLNPNTPKITCPTDGKAFVNMIRDKDTGTDGLCIEKTCSIPSELYDESDTTVNNIRKLIREGQLNQILLDKEIDLPSDEQKLRELKQYLFNTGSQDSQLGAYKVSEGVDLTNIDQSDLSMDNFRGITCSNNYYGEPQINCTTDEYSFTGCSEKYCSLPEYSDSRFYKEDERKKLLTLQKIQGGGITEQQFNKTYKNSSLDFGCGPLAFKTEDVVASCNTNGQTFEYKGCKERVLPVENSTTGHIIYVYYPGTCVGRRNNAFIYISGTDIMDTEKSQGSSVTHNIITDTLDTAGDTYYYNTESGVAQEARPDIDDLQGTSWIELQTKIKYEYKGDGLVEQNMKEFLDTTHKYADSNEDVGGYKLSKISKIAAEVYNIQKSGGKPDNFNEGDLLAFLSEGKGVLEFGTLISEQKSRAGLDDSCILEINEGYDWDEVWGERSSNDSNLWVYTDNDILRHERIPSNTSIFFKKIVLDTQISNPEKRWAWRDLSEEGLPSR
tara:strand:- start:8249 stop:13786 length:5538 start_codon:yes stop_codon:yes gene_type:complete